MLMSMKKVALIWDLVLFAGCALFVVCTLFVGCTSLPEPDFTPAGHSLRVVTYNINWGAQNPQNVAEYLFQVDADIICLQETHGEWEAFLKYHLSRRYPHGSFHASGGAGGIAFMSKHALKNVRVIEARAGWFPALLAEIRTGIGTVQVLNVHLKPLVNDKGSVSLSAYYEGLEIHGKELAGFLKETDLSAPLIIAGDFNENENHEAIKDLLSNGFKNALSQFDATSKTWQWRVMPSVYISNRYDHIIYSRHFNCTGVRVEAVDASDHYPVMAVFTRSGNEGK